MEIRITGKYDRLVNNIPWLSDGLVFVDYLEEDIFLEDRFLLESGEEIVLKEIKLQFDTKEPLTEMGRGWKCLCRFDGIDLTKIPAVKNWGGNPIMIAKRKE
jgi:hypothetical protein